MSQERAVYRVKNDLPRLAGVFDEVLQRVAAAPAGEPGRVMAAFAASLANGDEFNLAQIEGLPSAADRDLCLALFDYCMTAGLTEDERHEAAVAFLPYIEIHVPGTRQ
jgi:hypothetical protein